MPDFETMSLMYSTLSNALTDSIRILQTAQQATEEMFISSPSPELVQLNTLRNVSAGSSPKEGAQG